MVKKFILAILLLAVLIGAIVYTKLGQFKTMGEAGAKMVPPPTTVNATQAQSMDWQQTLSATGTVTALQGVVVSAETGGRVSSIEFEPGIRAKAGQVLVKLDTASESALLASARASAALAQSTLARARRLSKRQLVSRAEVDNAAAQAKAARAQVNVAAATLKRKTIVAPFDGQLGLRQVNVGQILREGDPIVSLQTMDPITADFSLPQQHLHRLTLGMKVLLTTDAAPGKSFEGQLVAISPQIDPVSRSFKAQAQFDNPDNQLRAGMYVDVTVLLPDAATVLAIPATAVQYATYGDSVFVVAPATENDDKKLKLEQKFVRLGKARGDFVAVEDGLKAGDTVVTSGVFKLRSGMPVVIDNSLAPKPAIDPKPPRS